MFGPPRSINFGSPINWGHPLCRGLVSWWLALPNWNRGYSWRDLCGRNHGTLTNMDPATDWQGPLGRPGGFGCLDFDGSNDYVNTGAISGFSGSQNLSISAWIYPTSLTGSKTILTSSGSIFFRVTDSVNVDIEIIILGLSDDRFSIGNLTTNAWQHVACTYSGTQFEIFLNGQSLGTDDTGGTYSAVTNPFLIGSRGGTIEFFSGRLDDICLWKRALSASEVSAIYNDSRRGHPEMLNWIRPTWYVDQAGGGGGGGIVRHMIAMAG